jgi:hypothetical protein
MDQPACPINLGNKQKRRRLILGILFFSIAGAFSVFFTYQESSAWLRLIVFPLYFISMLGFFQAKARTCVVFAYQNVQDLGEGEKPVADPSSSQMLKIKAQKILLQSAFIAFLLTATTFLVR